MAGARHSKADMESIQTVHDHAVRLGASCAMDQEQAKARLSAGTTALRGKMPDSWDTALSTASDAQSLHDAAVALASVAQLLASESWPRETGVDTDAMQSLVDVLSSLTSYIIGELMSAQEHVNATTQLQAAEAQQEQQTTVPMRSFGGAVKRTAPGSYTLRGVGVVYDSPTTTNRDLYGEYFTVKTDLGKSRSFVGMPVFYDHALRGIRSQIGVVSAWEDSADGLVFEVELDRNRQYVADVLKLADEGALGLSTGALSHLVVKSASGELLRWIIGELSVTPTPAEARTIGVQTIKTISGPEAGPEARNSAATAATGASPVIRIIP